MSWFASGHPDGLEWAMFKTTGTEEIQGIDSEPHQKLASVQEKSSFLPDYSFPDSEDEGSGWPTVNAGTTIAGLVGGGLTLLLAGAVGFALRRRPIST